MQAGRNAVQVVGEYASSCGYCHAQHDSSVAFGVIPVRLTVQAYQALLDRGWRRSGMWLYLPMNERTCCVCYTHRLDVTRFAPSKAQRKALRRFQAYAAGAESLQGGSPRGSSPPQTPKRRRTEAREATAEEAALADLILAAVQECCAAGTLPPGLPLPQPRVQPPAKRHLAEAGVRHTSAAAFQISAAARKAGGGPAPPPPQLAQLLAAALRPAQPLVRAEGGHLNFYAAATPAQPPAQAAGEADAAMRPAAPAAAPAAAVPAAAAPAEGPGAGLRVASGREPSGSSPRAARGGSLPLPPLAPQEASRLEVRLVRSSAALVPVEFPLYYKYQTRHHRDPPEQVTPKAFRRFLIESPLAPLSAAACGPGQAPACGFGSFHQQYWVAGVLVAVGVIDILPGCLSSKYFFWDPDLAHLSLGKVGALLEIEWVRGAMGQCPGLRHYYMGFYIHTCPKMRYKVEFEPAELLCPRTLAWVPFAAVRAALDGGQVTHLAAAAGLPQPPPDSDVSGDGDSGAAVDMRVRVPGAEPELLSLAQLRAEPFLPRSLLRTLVPNCERLAAYVGPLARELEVLLW